MNDFKKWIEGFGPFIPGKRGCKGTADYQVVGACSDYNSEKKNKKIRDGKIKEANEPMLPSTQNSFEPSISFLDLKNNPHSILEKWLATVKLFELPEDDELAIEIKNDLSQLQTKIINFIKNPNFNSRLSIRDAEYLFDSLIYMTKNEFKNLEMFLKNTKQHVLDAINKLKMA